MDKFIALFLMLAPLTMVAQREYDPHFAVGMKGGATLSQMSFSPSVKQSWLTGFKVGVIARYTEENHFGLIAELNIAQHGWKENFEEYGSDYAYSRTLTYIELPLMTHIYFGSPRFKGFFNAGPQVGYMISSSITSNFDYSSPSLHEITAFANRPTEQLAMAVNNRFDYGIAAGLGCEAAIGRRQSLMLEGRFYYGLGNIFSASRKDYFSASRGMSLEVTLGWMFAFK